MTEQRSIRDISFDAIERDFRMAIELGDRIQARGQILSATLALLIAIGSGAVAAIEDFGNVVDENRLKPWITVLALSAAIGLALSIASAWPRNFSFVHPDRFLMALRENEAYAYDESYRDDLIRLQRTLDLETLESYKLLLQSIKMQSWLLRLSLIMASISALLVLEIAVDIMR